MRITSLSYHTITVPFEAPMLWSGGVNRENEGYLLFYGHEDLREPRFMGMW